MGIKTVPQPLYSRDLAPCDFWLFPKLKVKLRVCRYETIEEMKEAVTRVIVTLTREDFHGAFQKLLGGYNKCIAAGEDYFEMGLEFHVYTINKSADKRDFWKLILCSLYIYIYIYINIYIYICVCVCVCVYVCVCVCVCMYINIYIRRPPPYIYIYIYLIRNH